MPFKLQKILGAKQERSRESLPKPPTGMMWEQDPKTREWRLLPNNEEKEEQNLSDSQISQVTQAAANLQLKNVQKEEEEGVDNENHRTAKDPYANSFRQSESSPRAGCDEDAMPEFVDSKFTVPEPRVIEDSPKLQEEQSQSQKLESPNLSGSSKSSTTRKGNIFLNMPPTGHYSDNEDKEFFVGEECKSSVEEDEEADWEVLSCISDRVSFTKTGIAFVNRAGSFSSHNSTIHSFSASVSSSTMDSHDMISLGPSGKGVLGVDYLEHLVLPDDTLQGICLTYKLSLSRLKRANHFTGDSLATAPKRLVIPISKKAIRQGYLRVQDTDSKEYKIHALQAELPTCGLTEAKAYLEMADWDLRGAIASAREDHEWESNLKEGELRAGEIRVIMKVNASGDQLSFSAQGAGYASSQNVRNTITTTNNNKKKTSVKPVDPNLIDEKAIKVEDIHSATTQHNSVGVELQSFSKN